MAFQRKEKCIGVSNGMNLLISDLDDTLFDTTNQLDETYSNIRNIKGFQGVRELLTLPNFKNLLVSTGDIHIQTIKLGVLKFGNLFHGIYICGTNKEKRFLFEEIVATHGKGIPRKNIFVLGNRLDAEVRYGNEIGLTTIFMKHGKYSNFIPRDSFEKPHFTVQSVLEAEKFLREIAIEGKGSRMSA